MVIVWLLRGLSLIQLVIAVWSYRLGMDRFVSFTPLEMFTLIFSAAVHDLRHPGVNNNFLVTTSHPLAVRYNDKSVSRMTPLPQLVFPC